MDPWLQLVIENDDIDELHRLIVKDRNLLHHASKGLFPNTPLHVASAAGKTEVAMEMAIMKPSFARKLNPEGYSPMHLALEHKHYNTARALMTLDPKLIRVRGRRGITPLHYVAEKEGDNELELLAEFLSACRSSIKDLTSQSETAVHIAIKNHNLKAFKVLFGWLKLICLTEILEWKDQRGNTVLHIAVSKKQPEIIKLLIGYTNENAKNFQDKTALEILQVNPCGDQDVAKRLRRHGRLARLYTPTFSLSQAFSMGKYVHVSGIRGTATRNITFGVCTLIATATYQAALSPPGGYWQDSSSTNSSDISTGKPHQAGNIILSGLNLYYFSFLNSTTFFISIGIIWAIAIPLLPGTIWVCLSLTYLGLAYLYSLISEFPKSEKAATALLEWFYISLLSAALGLSLYIWAKRTRDLKKIDATRRSL